MHPFSSTSRHLQPIQINSEFRANVNSDGTILKMPVDSKTSPTEFAEVIYFAHQRDFQVMAEVKEKTGNNGQALKKGKLIVAAVPSRLMSEIPNLQMNREKVLTLFSVVAKKNGFENILNNVKPDALFQGEKLAPSYEAWKIVKDGIEQQKTATNFPCSTGSKNAVASDIPESAWKTSAIYESRNASPNFASKNS